MFPLSAASGLPPALLAQLRGLGPVGVPLPDPAQTPAPAGPAATLPAPGTTVAPPIDRLNQGGPYFAGQAKGDGGINPADLKNVPPPPTPSPLGGPTPAPSGGPAFPSFPFLTKLPGQGPAATLPTHNEFGDPYIDDASPFAKREATYPGQPAAVPSGPAGPQPPTAADYARLSAAGAAPVFTGLNPGDYLTMPGGQRVPNSSPQQQALNAYEYGMQATNGDSRAAAAMVNAFMQQHQQDFLGSQGEANRQADLLKGINSGLAGLGQADIGGKSQVESARIHGQAQVDAAKHDSVSKFQQNIIAGLINRTITPEAAEKALAVGGGGAKPKPEDLKALGGAGVQHDAVANALTAVGKMEGQNFVLRPDLAPNHMRDLLTRSGSLTPAERAQMATQLQGTDRTRLQKALAPVVAGAYLKLQPPVNPKTNKPVDFAREMFNNPLNPGANIPALYQTPGFSLRVAPKPLLSRAGGAITGQGIRAGGIPYNEFVLPNGTSVDMNPTDLNSILHNFANGQDTAQVLQGHAAYGSDLLKALMGQ